MAGCEPLNVVVIDTLASLAARTTPDSMVVINKAVALELVVLMNGAGGSLSGPVVDAEFDTEVDTEVGLSVVEIERPRVFEIETVELGLITRLCTPNASVDTPRVVVLPFELLVFLAALIVPVMEARLVELVA